MEGGLTAVWLRLAHYVELAKPRVVAMVLLTTLVGLYLGAPGNIGLVLALNVFAGTALAAGGTLALNEYIERDGDAKMARTCHRPLPSGRLHALEALAFGMVATAGGCAYLWVAANPLCSLLTALTAFLYLCVYTPLKRVSWVCHMVGAIPGALPPVAGWAAARGVLGTEPMLLFAIMFLWQLPHSLSIARLYRKDYALAGMRLLPADDHLSDNVNRVIVAACMVLLLVGMAPALMGFAGIVYLVVAALLGAMLLFYALRLMRAPAAAAARRLMFASLIYLPAVFLLLVLDKV
jgi:heme o synthase